MDKLKLPDLSIPPTTINKIIQVIVGFVVVFIIYLLATLAVKADKLIIDSEKDLSKKRQIDIVDGYIDSANKLSINTSIPFANNYLPIKPSMNIKGGAQFTYQLWLFVDDPNSAAGKTIFIKGDPAKYNYKISENKYNIQTKQMENSYILNTIGQISKCPMLAFNSGGDAGAIEFHMEFNTLHNISESFDVVSIKSDNNIYRNNLLSVFAKQWFLVTIIFQDNIPINDFENGIIIKFYLNDVMYQQQSYKSTLKQNDGDLVLFPDSISGTKLTSMKYYNYAVSDQSIQSVYKKGPVVTPSLTFGAVTKHISYISDKNKLDIFNV
jgi:hypothetical protein